MPVTTVDDLVSRIHNATSPGRNFPMSLEKHHLSTESAPFQETVDGEENHGAEFAAMAQHVVDRAAGHDVFADIHDQAALADSGRYGVALGDPETHSMLEHPAEDLVSA
ncbi:hypothetical protein [Streptomyces sp. NPDC127108]|uniref:hypothetical protein n=1 Tax=Streptomyces sp. NPDC127108 TaxID=3345361 RepID=UPI00362C20B1